MSVDYHSLPLKDQFIIDLLANELNLSKALSYNDLTKWNIDRSKAFSHHSKFSIFVFVLSLLVFFTSLELIFSFLVEKMAPNLSKDNLQSYLSCCRAPMVDKEPLKDGF